VLGNAEHLRRRRWRDGGKDVAEMQAAFDRVGPRLRLWKAVEELFGR